MKLKGRLDNDISQAELADKANLKVVNRVLSKIRKKSLREKNLRNAPRDTGL